MRGLLQRLVRGRGGDADQPASVDDPEGRRLVERWRRGDPQAFADLFRTHRRLVHGVLYHLMPNDPDLEDVVQSAFVEVFRSLDRFEGRSRLSSWIARVALHVGYHHLRARRRRPALVRGLTALPEPADDRLGADLQAELERREIQGRVQQILALLSEKKRTVLLLSDFQGLPREEIAEIVGTNVVTVRTRLFHARKELWKHVEADPVLLQALGRDFVGRGRGTSVPGQPPEPPPVPRLAPVAADATDDEDDD